MIRAIIAAALLAAPVVGASQQASAPTYHVDQSTARHYTNGKGFLQVDAVVIFSSGGETGRFRTGVVGCADGKGQIAQVDNDGDPVGQVHQWSADGTAMRDLLARSICLVGAYFSKARKTEDKLGGWL